MEARRAWRRMTIALSEAAPGEAGLMLPPDPRRWPSCRTTGSTRGGGAPPRGGDPSRLRAGGVARGSRRSAVRRGPAPPAGDARHRPLDGSGGDAPLARRWNAVSVGDYHLPDIVGQALAREERGTDERMLELWSPTAGSGAGCRCSSSEATSPRPRTDQGWKPARSRSSSSPRAAARERGRPRCSRRRRAQLSEAGLITLPVSRLNVLP